MVKKRVGMISPSPFLCTFHVGKTHIGASFFRLSFSGDLQYFFNCIVPLPNNKRRLKGLDFHLPFSQTSLTLRPTALLNQESVISNPILLK